MVFRYCLGMTMSVSTLISFKGAATPSKVVNLSISQSQVFKSLACDRRSGSGNLYLRACREEVKRPLRARISGRPEARLQTRYIIHHFLSVPKKSEFPAMPKNPNEIRLKI